MCVSWISQSSLTRTDKQLEELEPVKEKKFERKLTERRTWKTVVKTVYISASEPEAIFRSSQKSLTTADTQATAKNTHHAAQVTQSQARKSLIEC